VRVTKLWGRDTVWFDKTICDEVEESVRSLGYSYKRMVSGAGHDAQFLASYIPTAMIFIPSVNGKSHCEEEFTPWEECEKGVNVLLETVIKLAQK
jgi:N-carbamoyl-L-amino-acid hydrolase